MTGTGFCFTDKSLFALSHADDRTRVYRRTNTRLADCFVLEMDRVGGGSMMVWVDNGWPEDGLGCNARQSECSLLYRRRPVSSCQTISP